MSEYRFSLTGLLRVRENPYSAIFYAVHIIANGGLNLFPTGNYTFKVSNRNTKTRCEICSKLTIKTPARRQ